MFIGLIAGRDDLEMRDQATRGLGYCDKVYREFEERFGTVLCRNIQKALYGREYELTRQEERDDDEEAKAEEDGIDGVHGAPNISKSQ